jgi:serine/threonine protein kinase
MIKCLTSTSYGTYAIDVKLGAGTSGSVFRARRIRDNKQLALKQIPKHLTDERQISEFLVT